MPSSHCYRNAQIKLLHIIPLCTTKEMPTLTCYRNAQYALLQKCPSGWFTCFSGAIRCISSEFACDCEADCGDGSDEVFEWAGCTAEQLSTCSGASGMINRQWLSLWQNTIAYYC